MSYNSTIELDQIDEGQSGKEETANNLFAAMSSAAMYGIQSVSGLAVALYGGNKLIAGTPTPIATQSLTLTDNTTNYVYTTAAGVYTKTTSIPAGWPGPLAADAEALYKFVTADGVIVSATSVNYVLGAGAKGTTGATGADGPPGTDLAETRKRLWMPIGGGSTVLTYWGFNAVTLVGTSATARSLASSSLRESIPYAAFPTGAGAGSSAQVYAPQNWCYLGNAAGRGGFDCTVRFCFESASSPSTQRYFLGLFDAAAGTLANAEPDTFVNIIGIGAKEGVANLSLVHNDGSGTATVTLLQSNGSPTQNFPARATDNVYELNLSSVANSGVVDYSLTNLNTGDEATGTIASNLPANTLFLTWVHWLNNGSAGGVASGGMMQVVGETRY